MSTELAVTAFAAISIFFFVASIVVPQDLALSVAVAGVITSYTLVVTDYSGRTTGIAALISIMLLFIGSLRTKLNPCFRGLVPLLLMLTWVAVMSSLTANHTVSALTYGAWSIALALTAACANALGDHLVALMDRLAPALILIEFLFAVREVIIRGTAIWPRRDGVSLNVLGENNLLPGIDVRAMGSTGYAITLGEIAAILACYCGFRAIETKLTRFWIAAILGIATIILSGTRTGLFMVAAAAATSLFLSKHRGVRTATVLIGLPLFAFLMTKWIPVLLSDSVFISSSSVTHRIFGLTSVEALLGRPGLTALFGSGPSSIAGLFETGTLGAYDGISVFDNEFLRTLTSYGVLGFFLLILVLIVAFRHQTIAKRSLLIALVVGMATYDVFTWNSLFVWFVIACGYCAQSSKRRTETVCSEQNTMEHFDGNTRERSRP